MQDSNDTQTNDAFGMLWRVNFTFIDTNDFIRSKTLVINAPNAIDAQSTALQKIASYKHSRVGSIKPY